MIYYLLGLGIVFVYDKIKKKVITILFKRTAKMICWRPEWELEERKKRPFLLDLVDWIVL
jgi:hypothetical protein